MQNGSSSSRRVPARKTAELPYSVYEARAISKALHSVLQTGAQSLDSFSVVENGKVLFDQISAQSNVQIAGYRVLSTTDHGDKVSARLEILLLPTDQNETQISCRQPNNLDLVFEWQGFYEKKSLPFWVQFDELSLTQTIEAMMAANRKFNFQENNSDRSRPHRAIHYMKMKTHLKGLYRTICLHFH
jgi:hypothetical protein